MSAPGAARGVAALLGALVGLPACNPPFRPAPAPQGWTGSAGVRVDAMRVGPEGDTLREREGALRLLVTTHAPDDARIVAARLTRVTRRACTGGARALTAQLDGAPEAPLPASVGGDHRVALAFRTTPEEALDGPTALDVVVEQHGHLRCVRTELGPADAWHRPQAALDVALTVGAPLRPLGNLGTPWMLEDRVGALLGPVEVGGGLRVGGAACGACNNDLAVLFGPSFAATLYPYTARPLALAVSFSYASLFESVSDTTDAPGSLPRIGEWYQVPGLSLELDWLSPPRNGHVRLRGRDFNDWGLEVFEQLWIPTLHAERPTTVLGVGLVSRLAL